MRDGENEIYAYQKLTWIPVPGIIAQRCNNTNAVGMEKVENCHLCQSTKISSMIETCSDSDSIHAE